MRKASDKELEGIFSRLTPAERKQYSVVKQETDSKRKSPEEPRKDKVTKKKASKPVIEDDFINDDSEESDYASGSDISLVSESDLEMVEEEKQKTPKVKKEKKHKKSRSSTSDGRVVVKKFTWS